MSVTLLPGQRRGTVTAPASKSHAQRLLLAAALGNAPVTLYCRGLSRDIAAMIECLRALGAEIVIDGDALRVTPIARLPRGTVDLRCGESGATLRFLLPVVGALGVPAVFHPEGRPRPIAPLTETLRAHGMEITAENGSISCKGKLLAGDYAISAEISSQYVTGLLYALPLLSGDSTLTLTGEVVSAPYLALTEQALRGANIRFDKSENRYTIPGGQVYAQSDAVVEGDWSGAAAFLCMGALSRDGVTVRGLDLDSVQADRTILDVLRRFGAGVETAGNAATAAAMAMRWSFAASTAPPRSLPRPWMTRPSGVSAASAPRAASIAAVVCRRSDSLSLSRAAPVKRVSPAAVAATAASTGSRSGV